MQVWSLSHWPAVALQTGRASECRTARIFKGRAPRPSTGGPTEGQHGGVDTATTFKTHPKTMASTGFTHGALPKGRAVGGRGSNHTKSGHQIQETKIRDSRILEIKILESRILRNPISILRNPISIKNFGLYRDCIAM